VEKVVGPAPISRELSSFGAGSSLRYEACWPCYAVAYRYAIYRLLAVYVRHLSPKVTWAYYNIISYKSQKETAKNALFLVPLSAVEWIEPLILC